MERQTDVKSQFGSAVREKTQDIYFKTNKNVTGISQITKKNHELSNRTGQVTVKQDAGLDEP